MISKKTAVAIAAFCCVALVIAIALAANGTVDMNVTEVDEKPLEYITPEMFGAIGDGKTDDTEAFVSLFRHGGHILLRHNAIYLLNSGGQQQSFVLGEGTVVDFNGAIIESNYKYSFRNFDPLEDASVLGYDGNGNIEFRNGTVKYACFTFNHADSILMHNMRFIDCSGIHAFQFGGCRDVRIEDCTFMGMVYAPKGTIECINIECMDRVGQPYFAEGSPTYDHTPTSNLMVRRCTFTPDCENDTYGYMGCAVGTHYVPKTKDGATVSLGCDCFTNIRVIENTIVSNADTYAIRCNNWKDSEIIDNNLQSLIGIQLADNYMSNDNIVIKNNNYQSTSESSWFAMLKSGNNTNLALLNNTVDGASPISSFDWTASHNLAQGMVAFKACDGIALINSLGASTQNTESFALHTSLSFEQFDWLVIRCTPQKDMVVDVPLYIRNDLTSSTAIDSGSGCKVDVSVVDERTVTCNYPIREVIGTTICSPLRSTAPAMR